MNRVMFNLFGILVLALCLVAAVSGIIPATGEEATRFIDLSRLYRFAASIAVIGVLFNLFSLPSTIRAWGSNVIILVSATVIMGYESETLTLDKFRIAAYPPVLLGLYVLLILASVFSLVIAKRRVIQQVRQKHSKE